MERQVMPAASNLSRLFSPASVAIIGASQSPGKFGYQVLQNLKACGYTGEIYPVNRAMQGSAYASVGAIGRPVDCAFIVVPAESAMEALAECADNGVRTVVIGASGFAESGSAAAVAAQARIGEIAKASGMRVLGPNTNGLINTACHLSLGFNSEHARPQKRGSIAIASHSGALLGGIAATLRLLGGGLSSFVAVGNEADLSMLDVLDYMLDDVDTTVVGLVLEGLSDGDRFVELARKARHLGKRLVALKIGRSSAGAHAALAHSSRLSGSARAYDALLANCGVASVRSVESLTGACVTLSMMRPREPSAPMGDARLTCISTSGAGGALLADFADELGLPVACGGTGSWEQDVQSQLMDIPSNGQIGHPLDVGALKGNWAAADDIMRVLEKHGRGGPVVAYVHNGPTQKRDTDLVAALSARRLRTHAPVAVVAPGGLDDTLTAQYLAASVPVFRDMASGFESLASWRATSGFWMSEPATMPRPARAGATAATSFLPELESSALMRAAGIPVVESFIVRGKPDVEAFFKTRPGPFVMKALPEGVAHKNDAGMVLVDIAGQDAAMNAWQLLQDRLVRGGFSSNSTVVMQPMVRSKAELIVGVSREPGLGHFLVVGLGGVHAEILDEVLLFPLRTMRSRVEDVIANSRIGALLSKIDPAATARKSLFGLLHSLKTYVESNAGLIDSIDLNPVLVTDEGCIAVDALVCQRTRD